MRIVICGAGFGGLEITSRLSGEFGDGVEITLIDKNNAFVFGFSKFEVMLGRETREQVSSRYSQIDKPGVRFRQELITAIDPEARRVTTEAGTYDADVLVVALGADYDFGATPGFVEGGHEFYSVDGAARLRDVLPGVTSGDVIVAVLGEPFKCPPAPCEAVMLLDDYFRERGVRDDMNISLVTPWGVPLPPSPDASKAILEALEERNLRWMPSKRVVSIDPATKTAHLADGETMPYELFLGVPVHRVPAVVEESGLAVDGWIPVDKTDLSTRFKDVYAVGDVTSVGVPKAGVFAEGAGRTVAENLAVRLRGEGAAARYNGAGSCYIEFGGGNVGRVDVDFLTGPTVTAPFTAPSAEGAEEKEEFGASRRRWWFGD
jgi:sulfide:quinone oxidoreductase